MRLLQNVLWRKGIVLTPQHMQAQDRFLRDTIDFHRSAFSADGWGFGRLQIDREALAGGSLAVSSGAGIFPDGLLFDFPGSDRAPEPRPLAEDWPHEADALRVHLAVPERRPEGRNVALDGADASRRYAAEVVTLRDENTGTSEKPVQVARKNLRLLTESESMDGYTTIPVARILREETGAFALDADFIPPMIDFAANERLASIARRLVEILSAKSNNLSAARRERGRGLADFGVADTASFWLLYTVNTHLPAARHFHETRGGHPAELFRWMVDLAGALTTFSSQIRPQDFPSYNHADPGPCFLQLDGMVRELLETVIPTRHVALPLKPTEPSVWATAIDQDRYLDAEGVYLAVAARLDPADLARRAPELLKVSSGDGIDRLITQALRGIRLTHRPSPPSALPVKLDYAYFEVERSGQDWNAVRQARNLAVHVPDELPEPRLELVLLLPPE